MSMNTYPLKEDAGFVIDTHTAALIVLMNNIKRNECSEAVKKLLETETPMSIITKKLIPDEEFDDYYDAQYAYEILTDDDVCGVVFASDFTGEVNALDKQINLAFPLPLDEDYQDDLLVYIEPNHMPDYFLKAYDCVNDLLDEYKEKLAPYLPEGFPIDRNVAKIYGTYFC